MVVRPLPSQSSDPAPAGGSRAAPTGSAPTGSVATGSAPTAARGPLIHVSTRCITLDDFVDKFSGFASYGALVLPAAGELPAGTEARFVVRLADQTVAMRGRCRVTDVKTVQVSPPGAGATGPRRTLLRVALLEMEEGSRTVHARLLAHRRQAVPLTVTAAESEPTLVSPHAPVPPPPLRAAPPPPVAALARTMTMIGVAPPGGAGAGVPASKPIVAPPPPSALARTMLGVAPATAAPPPERRAPGAAFTLPANPLSAMPSDDLVSFIDSTLIETDDEDATAERLSEPPKEVELPIEEGAAVEAAPTAVVGAVEHTSRVGARPLSARRLAARVAPSAICLIVGLLVGRAWLAPARTPAPAPPPTAAAAAAQPPASAAVPAKPAPTPAPVVEPERPIPAARAESAARKPAAPEGCSARIVTEPADAKIIWGGKVLGQSPIQVAHIPCGVGTVTIERERYQPVTREVTAGPEAAVFVSQKLHRPPGTLVVNSSPPGAYVTVNDQMLGAAPRRLTAFRFEQVSIRATFPGYQPWTKKVYLKEPTTTVAVQLVATGHGGAAAKRPPAAR